jgi:hypothetical protein
MAEAVVEMLEAVQVDDEQRQRLAARLGAQQPFAERGGEGRAVQQTGQGVGAGEAQHHRALGFKLGDASGEILGGGGLKRHEGTERLGWIEASAIAR